MDISWLCVLQVAVISTSQVGNSNDAGDPSLVVVPPVRHYGTDYMFATPEYTKPPTGSTSNQYDINIIVSLLNVYSSVRRNYQIAYH